MAEVEGLLDRGFREGVTAPQAIGYKEIVEALDGFISLDEAVERIKLATRRYAKRQRTWFRKARVSGGSMRRRAIFRRSSKKRSSCLMTALPDGFSRRRNACDMIRSHGHTPAVEPFKIGAPIMQTAHAFL